MEIIEALVYTMNQEGIAGVIKETASGRVIEVFDFKHPVHVWLLDHEFGIGLPWSPAVDTSKSASEWHGIVERLELANPLTTPELVLERVRHYGTNGLPAAWRR